jgi:hypothetical protein
MIGLKSISARVCRAPTAKTGPSIGAVVEGVRERRRWRVDEYFDWVRTLDLPNDVLRERDQPEDDMRDLLPS